MTGQETSATAVAPEMSNSWELVEYIHPALLSLDYTQTRVKFAIIGASFALWAVVFVLSAIVASATLTYQKLRLKEKIFWNLALVRASFGFFSMFVGAWAIFTHTEMDKDVVFGTTSTSHFALLVTVGFFLFECGALTLSDIFFKSFSFLLNLHHWLSLVGYSLVIYIEAGHCFGCKGLILEMSTPFSALCWTLLKAGKERSLLWKANQFLLVHAFHLRNVVECLFWYISYQNWTYIRENMPTSIFLALYVQLTLVSLIMTPYWTYKKTVQMINPIDWNFESQKRPRNMNYANGNAETETKKEQ